MVRRFDSAPWPVAAGHAQPELVGRVAIRWTATAAGRRMRRAVRVDRGKWLRAVRRAIWAAFRRADARHNALSVAKAIADWAHGELAESWPTIDRLMRITGLAERTVQKWCRWLEHGWLIVTEPGSCPRYPHSGYRSGALAAGSTNLARTWQLVIPEDADHGRQTASAHGEGLVSDRSCTPSQPATPASPSGRARDPSPPVTGRDQESERRSAACSFPAPPRWPVQSRMWPLTRKAQRRRERLAACEAMRAGCVALVPLSARALRSICRPWFDQGLTPAQILAAVSSGPDGQPHLYAGKVRAPSRWLAARLALHLDEDGRPQPPPAGLAAQPPPVQLRDPATAAAAPMAARRGASRIREMLRQRGLL